jgi:hypothetical protein
MLALGARGTGFNSRVPDKIDFGFVPPYNWYMPILDEKRRREYQKLYHLKTWDKRKSRHKILKRVREQVLVKWLIEYKDGKQCEVCGEDYYRCLDFHHKNPTEKFDTVSDLVAKGYGRETILNEIKKCSILCKNCHVKLHDKRI